MGKRQVWTVAVKSEAFQVSVEVRASNMETPEKTKLSHLPNFSVWNEQSDTGLSTGSLFQPLVNVSHLSYWNFV